MTDQEIDYALALAIGYPADRVRYWPLDSSRAFVQIWNSGYRGDGPMPFGGWQRFDHTDPAVIWPIAERFKCFPFFLPVYLPNAPVKWLAKVKADGTGWTCGEHPTEPATASALAVIQYVEGKV